MNDETIKKCNNCAPEGLTYSLRNGRPQVMISENYMSEARDGVSYMQQASALADMMARGEFGEAAPIMEHSASPHFEVPRGEVPTHIRRGNRNFTLAETDAADVLPGGAPHLLGVETKKARLERKRDEWKDAMDEYEKKFQECKQSCIAEHGVATAEYYKCMNEKCNYWAELMVWAAGNMRRAEKDLKELPAKDANKPADEEEWGDTTAWKKWGKESLEHVKDGLEALDEDDVDGFAKGKVKDVIKGKAKEKIEEETGYDPDTKPSCALAGMMLIAQVLAAGYTGLGPKQAAAQAHNDLKNDATYKLAIAGCLLNKGKSTDPITMCEAWLKWAEAEYSA